MARAHYRARLALGLLCAALGGLLALELAAGVGTPAPVAAAGPPQPAALPGEGEPPAAFELDPLESYAEVLERPVFVEGRRPVATAVAGPALALDSVRLVGVVRTPAGIRALVEQGNPPRLERLGEGAALGGWTVEGISADRVTLARGGERTELRLKDRPPAPGSQPPVMLRQPDNPVGTAARPVPPDAAPRPGQALTAPPAEAVPRRPRPGDLD